MSSNLSDRLAVITVPLAQVLTATNVQDTKKTQKWFTKYVV